MNKKLEEYLKKVTASIPDPEDVQMVRLELEHFLEQKCRGVYVTHLKELSEGDERIVSLRALVEEVEVPMDDSPKTKIRNIRKFKIIRSEAQDLGYADDLVDKYQLTYEQIKDRMKHLKVCKDATLQS